MHLGRVALVVPLIGLAAACGSTQGNGMCAPIAFLDGREFVTQNAVVHPTPGTVVGQMRIPGCNDTGQDETRPDGFRSVASLPGVDASVAVVDAEDPETIYVIADRHSFPPELDRYFVAPTCREADAPIDLGGPWLAIPGTDANVDPDPVPPYSVEMLVTDTSAPRYANAELTILVTPSLGMPITHADVEGSLWTGGTIHVLASCRGDRFVADSVLATPPQS